MKIADREIMEKVVPFFVIDDDDSIVATLKAIISKVFSRSPIYVANDGVYADSFISKNTEPMVVICDLNLPGINGLQLLKKVRGMDHGSQIFFMIMTSTQDKETTLKTLQAGADDFLRKPFAVDDLIGKLRLAVKIVTQNLTITSSIEQVVKLNDELKQEGEKMKNLLITFLSMKIPDYTKHIKFIKDATVWIASELSETTEEELNDIRNSAELCYSGRLAMPESMVMTPVLVEGQVRNEKMEKVPESAKQFLSYISGFEEVAKNVYHIYENYDGSGIPEKVQGWQIPLGARILRVVLDYYENITFRNTHPSKALEQLEHESRRLYDFRLITLLDQYNATHGASAGKEKAIRARDLEDGMIVSRNIITQSGLKIMGSGNRMDFDKIQKITSIVAADPVIGSVYYYVT